MKYIGLITAALAVGIVVGFLIVRLIAKRRNHALSALKTGVLSTLTGIVILSVAGFGYLEAYSHADEDARGALIGNGTTVHVALEGSTYAFYGPGDETALVFYPGGKVEAAAYAPLMCRLAEQGIDCFLVEMPFRMAPLDANAADAVIKRHDYDHWIIAGHSLGGTFAAYYATGHADRVDGVALLAAYPTKPLASDTPLCSIVGSQDGCLDQGEYAKAKLSWPKHSTEVVIEGGNHAQFGNYGLQDGDGTARISADEQQRQTAQAILELAASL